MVVLVIRRDRLAQLAGPVQHKWFVLLLVLIVLLPGSSPWQLPRRERRRCSRLQAGPRIKQAHAKLLEG